MSTPIEAYLSSPDAERDVAALLALPDAPMWGIGAGGLHDSTLLAGVAIAGAWRKVALGSGGHFDLTVQGVLSGRLPVYYRPDGDRYIVTDLGEAVRALRLRTGILDVEHLAEPAKRDVVWRDEHDRPAGISLSPGDVLRTFNACTYGAEGYTVSAAALPRAIVAIMLASHRIATLEIP